MKIITTLLFSLISLSAFAQLSTSLKKEIQGLNRIQRVVIGTEQHDYGFMSGYESAHYKSAWDNIELSIIKETATTFKVQIFTEDDELITFVIDGRTTGKVAAEKVKVKAGSSLETRGNNSYHYQFTNLGAPEKISVELKSPLLGKANLVEVVTRTGSMDFNPCDGCEHGDQLVLDNVNVIEMELGTYYEGDCEGTFHRLLAQLLVYNSAEEKDGLSVPFTYKGSLNFDMTDLVEEVTGLWNADEHGKLTIGTTTIPVPRFLDSMVYKVAEKMKVEAHKIWDDVMEKGEFTTLKNNVLTFKYKNVEVKTDLKTGNSI
ncbi:MAG: hypothetical protein V4598_05710 [Bdellovibrionota bacterium]